jgi:hypothetical protein
VGKPAIRERYPHAFGLKFADLREPGHFIVQTEGAGLLSDLDKTGDTFGVPFARIIRYAGAACAPDVAELC